MSRPFKVLVAGGVEVGLKNEVIDNLQLLGDPQLSEDIRKDAVALGLEDKLGGQPVAGLRKSRTQADTYYVETNLEGMLHRVQHVTAWMDRAEDTAGSALAHVAALSEHHARLREALASKDVDAALALLDDVIAPHMETALRPAIERVTISEEDVQGMRDSEPKDAPAPELEGFVMAVPAIDAEAPAQNGVEPDVAADGGAADGAAASDSSMDAEEMGYTQLPADDYDDEAEQQSGSETGAGPDANTGDAASEGAQESGLVLESNPDEPTPANDEETADPTPTSASAEESQAPTPVAPSEA